jgi:hypothetical protein
MKNSFEIVTWWSGPSLGSRLLSVSGDPIMKDPAGIRIIRKGKGVGKTKPTLNAFAFVGVSVGEGVSVIVGVSVGVSVVGGGEVCVEVGVGVREGEGVGVAIPWSPHPWRRIRRSWESITPS